MSTHMQVYVYEKSIFNQSPTVWSPWPLKSSVIKDLDSNSGCRHSPLGPLIMNGVFFQDGFREASRFSLFLPGQLIVQTFMQNGRMLAFKIYIYWSKLNFKRLQKIKLMHLKIIIIAKQNKYFQNLQRSTNQTYFHIFRKFPFHQEKKSEIQVFISHNSRQPNKPLTWQARKVY